MAKRLLDGFRALDLTDVKGFICGKILASTGVEVIKLEKPGLNGAGEIPPYARGQDGKRESLYWLAFNTDKRCITLNLETDMGCKIFLQLVEKVDFVLESFTPGYLDDIGLGYTSLSRVNPRIIVTSISPFGQSGPYARYKGSELIVSAMSGVMHGNGDPDRAPLREGPDSIYLHGGAVAASASIIAHYFRENTGEGQQVDVSLQEVAASRTSTDLIVWEFDKRLLKRSSDVRTVGARSTRWIWQCKDGYIFWPYMGGPGGAPANRAISRWMDDIGLDNPLSGVKNWEEFDMAGISPEELNRQQDAIANLFMHFTKKEISAEGVKRGIRASVVKNPVDVLDDAQLSSRDFWQDIEHSDLGISMKYPKYFFRTSETHNYITRRAPQLGEDNASIYTSELGISTEELKKLKKEGII